MMWLAILGGTVAGALVSGVVAHRFFTRLRRERVEAARRKADSIKRVAKLDAQTTRHSAEANARERGMEQMDRAESKLGEQFEQLARRDETVAKREAAVEIVWASSQEKVDAMNARERSLQSMQDRAASTERDVEAQHELWVTELEKLADATGRELKAAAVDSMVLAAQAEAAQRLRIIDQNSADPEYGKQAKRIMGISVQRYYGHYLTERLLSNISIPQGFADKLQANDGRMMKAIEEVSTVKLELSETGEKVRVDSGDGVAREIARRALNKMIKGTLPRDANRDPQAWLKRIADNLSREIVGLGRKAFAELKIPKAHADIVTLVGRLNYRTSYTQNQWKHAIEAAFLAGMMSSELGLDVKLARRATLMHDIGKSLTHEIEGSHAVIGADYARRLGEKEIVANAIGSHHADEPPNSLYAHIVAAADALSGARPGARREQSDNYATRLGDIERIGSGFRGVEQVFAVSGGREVRVYVKDEVDDAGTVALSEGISKKISDELTYPGQIKVTVIRQYEAVSTAS